MTLKYSKVASWILLREKSIVWHNILLKKFRPNKTVINIKSGKTIWTLCIDWKLDVLSPTLWGYTLNTRILEIRWVFLWSQEYPLSFEIKRSKMSMWPPRISDIFFLFTVQRKWALSKSRLPIGVLRYLWVLFANPWGGANCLKFCYSFTSLSHRHIRCSFFVLSTKEIYSRV